MHPPQGSLHESGTNSFVGQLAINYGQPVWKAEYEDLGLFDKMTKGQV